MLKDLFKFTTKEYYNSKKGSVQERFGKMGAEVLN
jgi:hypothetical protein